MNPIRKFLSHYRESVLWIPSMLVAAIVTFYLVRAFDPRSGMDGFGSLFDLFLAGVKASFLVAMVYLTKKSAFHDYTCAEETELRSRAEQGIPGSRFLLVLDTLQWLALAVLFYFLLY